MLDRFNEFDKEHPEFWDQFKFFLLPQSTLAGVGSQPELYGRLVILPTSFIIGFAIRRGLTGRKRVGSDPPRQNALAEMHEGRNHGYAQECRRRSLLRSLVRV